MRKRPPLLALLAAVCLAGAARAADGDVAGVKPPVLRMVPAQAAKPATTRKAPPAPILAAIAPRLSSPTPADTGQCRLSCAQSYSFCFETDEPDTCGGVWTSCLAA